MASSEQLQWFTSVTEEGLFHNQQGKNKGSHAKAFPGHAAARLGWSPHSPRCFCPACQHVRRDVWTVN